MSRNVCMPPDAAGELLVRSSWNAVPSRMQASTCLPALSQQSGPLVPMMTTRCHFRTALLALVLILLGLAGVQAQPTPYQTSKFYDNQNKFNKTTMVSLACACCHMLSHLTSHERSTKSPPLKTSTRLHGRSRKQLQLGHLHQLAVCFPCHWHYHYYASALCFKQCLRACIRTPACTRSR